jgi:hypothetical protein
MMKDVLEMKPESEEAGLRAFARQGCLLPDAMYTPVNHEKLSHSERNQRIMRDLPFPVDELRHYLGPSTRVVPVKANICELLEATLIGQGFPVVWRCGLAAGTS